MRQKILIGFGIFLLIGILGYFLGATVVAVGLLCLGIGYWIARKRKVNQRGKDIVIRMRR